MARSPRPIRTALEALQLEFPGYRITQIAISGKRFCTAEAVTDGIQPRFAQAETVERLRVKLCVPEVEFDATAPSIARVYDFLLAGKDNFEADRQQAAKVLDVYPQAAELAIQARQFQARAVTHVAQVGIGQFLDLGCGLPTGPNTHDTAQAVQPDARIVYVDNDAQVLSHARNRLAQHIGVMAAAGDIAHPAEILFDWRIRNFVNFHQPLCLVLAMTLHFFPPDQAQKITAELIANIPPGSYVIMSVVGGDAELGEEMTRTYTAARVYNHGPGGLAHFMNGLDLLEPGIVQARQWRAPVFVPGQRRGQAWAAVGRKAVPGRAAQHGPR